MSWIKYAKPGDKVVCVKRGGWREVRPGEVGATAFPIFGGIYTIGYIVVDYDEVFLKIVEIETGYFGAIRFRPLEKRNPDLSIFHEMLNKAPAKTLEEV